MFSLCQIKIFINSRMYNKNLYNQFSLYLHHFKSIPKALGKVTPQGPGK